jgi:hypothetical protein
VLKHHLGMHCLLSSWETNNPTLSARAPRDDINCKLIGQAKRDLTRDLSEI